LSILVVGSVALDTVETPSGKVEDALGGAATYFSMAARHFAEVRMVATVGTDFPEEHIEMLDDAGVDLRGLAREEGRTFRWAGKYFDELNRRETLLTELGVFENFKPKIPEDWEDTDLVFLANIDPELQLSVLDQVKKPRVVACDTMDFWIEGKPDALRALLKRTDVVVINDDEAKMLSGHLSLPAAARFIRGMGPKWVVIKQGEYGALMFSDHGFFSAPALLLEDVRDPTGAGDTFAGGFMGALARSPQLNDEAFRRAIIVGSVLASFAVEDFSLSRLATVTTEEVWGRYKTFEELARIPSCKEIGG